MERRKKEGDVKKTYNKKPIHYRVTFNCYVKPLSILQEFNVKHISDGESINHCGQRIHQCGRDTLTTFQVY